MSYGQDVTLGLSFQNSFDGTANISSLYFLEVVDESLSLSIEQLTRQGMKGLFDENVNQEGKNSVDAEITIEGMAVPLGVLLSAIFDRSSTAISSNYYSHTFTPKQADFDKFCAMNPITGFVDLADGGSAHTYPNLAASKIDFTIANGEFLTAKLGVLGGAYAQTNSVNVDSASFITGDAIDWSLSSLSFGGTGQCFISDMTIAVDESLEAKHMLCTTKAPSRIKRSGKRTISINGTIQFDDQTEYQKFKSQSTQQFIATFRMSSEMLKFDLPQMKYTEFPLDVGGPGQMEIAFNAKAEYHTGSGNAMTVTLINTMAGY